MIHVSENCATIIGEDVTIGHCAILEDCTIEAGALIGTNAVILNGAVVGSRSLIAAGSVSSDPSTIAKLSDVTLPPESVAAGAPAVVKKKLEGAAVAWVDHAGPEYVHLSRTYRRIGIGDPEIHEIEEVS